MYEDFYHLRAKPFRLSPDPSFFFASRGHKRALAYLRYGLMQDEGFVVITGAPGTGKTTLAQILLEEMDQSELVVAQLTTSQLDPDELLRMVAASFGLRYDGVNKAGLLKTMEAFLMARAREKKRALLVVDEAQNLPPKSLEELRMLSNLMVGGKALLQTFLLGQPQFRNMLDNPDLEQLRQRVTANYHLSELAQDECQSYIETRLQHVGWQGDPKITAAAYDGIYQYTQGIPRRINMLCDRLMLFGCLEHRHEIDNSVLRDVTDELQQEISGKPIKKDESDDDVKSKNAKFDPLTGQLVTEQSAEDEEQSLEEYFGTDFSDNENTVEELEAQDQHSAYSLNQAAGESGEEHVSLESDTENNLLDKVVPDDGYDKLDMQSNEAAIEDGNEAHAHSNAPQQNTVQNNKDRLQVITGGRDTRSTNSARVTKMPVKPAASPAPKSTVATPAPDVSGDSDEVILRKILRMVLAFHRSPRSFPGLDDPSQLLPRGVKHILLLAVSDDETLKSLRQISVMGISPAMLRAAVRFFVRRVLFIPGGDDYRVLGLPSDATLVQVEEQYGLLMRLMRQEKQGSGESGVSRIGESYERLCQIEITHVPEESLDEKNGEEKEDLDLDLAPNMGGIADEGKNINAEFARVPDVITSDQRTGPTGRNIVLIIGTVVVVFVLYLTQISVTDKPDANTETANSAEQQLVDSGQQGVGASSEQTTNFGDEFKRNEQAQVDAAGMSDVSTVEPEEVISQANAEDEETQRQRILMELRAESDVLEKTRREAEAVERAKLEAKLEKAAKAQAAAEARAKQEAQARARAEAAVKEAIQAKVIAEAKAKAALKAKKDQAIAQAKARAKAEAAAKARAKKKTAVVVKAPPKPVDSKTRKLDVFVTELENAYAAGNLDVFMRLFAASAKTNDKTDLTGIRADYRSFFDGTTSRKLSLNNLDWKLGDYFAQGIGDYKVITRSKGASSDAVSAGEITLQLKYGIGGRLQIMRFYFSETKSNNKLTESSGARPSTNDLNRTLENFASAYKEGNIERFMALFSPGASTNDRSTLQGIRGDYVDLFSGTDVRRLDHSSMQWQWDGDVANGVGTYVVTVQPKGKDKKDIYRGKSRFSVKRYNNKLLISRFVFE